MNSLHVNRWSVFHVACVLLTAPLLFQSALAQTTILQSQADSRRSRPGPVSELVSGEYEITQSWSQESKFERTYHVKVPGDKEVGIAGPKKFPVFLFLHGNGGNAAEAMRVFLRDRRQISCRYILVFAQGYRDSWNIVAERSKADDVGFIEAIVLKLASFENVDADNVTIMGVSNGAAMVNQLAIESKIPNIRNYISSVSPLNRWQYDGTNFKARGNDNSYRSVATPLTGKRIMNISGSEDHLVPYRGGPSKHIPAKNGKLAFVDAEQSVFLWARQMGYEGERLDRPSKTAGKIEVFCYLGGDVIHYKVSGAGHGATREISEHTLLDFLQSGETVESSRQNLPQ